MNWKIEALKRLDSIIGKPASVLARAFVKPRKNLWQGSELFTNQISEDKLKLLVIRPGGIGDAVLLFPTLKVLKEHFKNSEIEILAEKRNADLLKGNPYLNKVHLYDSRPPLELFKTLSGNYDIVIDTEQWHRFSAVVAYLTRAPVRVGFATNDRSELFTHNVSYSHEQYEANSFLNLASAITGENYDINKNEPFIPIDSELIERFDNTIQILRKRSKSVIGIFTGATITQRRWELARFVELSSNLSQDGVGIVILGGEEDVDGSKRIEKVLGKSRIINYAGRTSLLETAAIISLLDLFVSSDTGLMHIAYGVGTPTVSLFGAGIQKKWAPIGNHNIVINKNLTCSPCTKFGYTPRCPYHVRCLNEITVEEVKDYVLSLISRAQNS
ncbi:MAG: glycosyltransferase family 9 protein [Thermodesulfobacteriota bacterium]